MAKKYDAVKEETVSGKYSHAPEVQKMAKKLIEKHHSHLVEARIKYLFRHGNWVSKGEVVLGKAKLAAEDTRFLGEYDFVILINAEAWKTASLQTREALIDHELCHCICVYDKQDNRKWSIIEHDVTEFVQVIARHGLWQDVLRRFMRTAKTAPKHPDEVDLFSDEEASGDGQAEQPTVN